MLLLFSKGDYEALTLTLALTLVGLRKWECGDRQGGLCEIWKGATSNADVTLLGTKALTSSL